MLPLEHGRANETEAPVKGFGFFVHGVGQKVSDARLFGDEECFELLSTEYDWWGFQPGTLFLLGIFSLLDVILGMQMTDLADKLPLDPKLKAALRRDAKSEYLPLFHLLSCLEDGDWSGLEIQVRQLGLELEQVKSFHVQARDWSATFFSMQHKA